MCVFKSLGKSYINCKFNSLNNSDPSNSLNINSLQFNIIYVDPPCLAIKNRD